MFPQIFGKYVLEREIASGGMARVFLATLRGAGGFEKKLVVKQIRPELATDQSFIRRFVTEAKTTVELSHGNIVPVYELGAERGTYYIAMEFCAGASLDELLRRGRLSPAEGAYIGVEICRALDYAFRKAGIVHRDVTPRNVMIDSEGMVRLIDFGIAASASSGSDGPAGPLFGSPGHMAPEQFRRGPLSPAADVFSVAALLREAWLGEPPFRRATTQETRTAMLAALPVLGECVPELASLSELIDAALAEDPALRPQTAEDLARPLREFLRASDLGDIARGLAVRVREHVETSEEETHESRPAPVEFGCPATPPLAEHQTASSAERSVHSHTFAVTDAMASWTARIDSQPPNAVARTSVFPAPTVGPEPTRRDSATLSSGVTSSETSNREEPRSRLARVTWRVPLGVALSVVVAAFGVSSEGSNATGAGGRAPASEPRAFTEPSIDTPLQPGPPPTRPVASRVPAVGDPPSGASKKPGLPRPSRGAHEAAALVRRGTGQALTLVRLTSRPPARVHVDSRAVGQTPIVDLRLTRGSHEFVFFNAALDEKLATRATVLPGRRLHADFTSATPQIHVR